MELRIVSGELRGRRVRLSGAAASLRPTSQRVREAVAESLKTSIPGACVADLCAGSGAFGFEMISRGAGSVDFVENHRERCRLLRAHVELFGVQTQCRVVAADVRRFVLRPGARRYNIVFYDPPYGDAALVRIVPDIAGLLAEGGICVVEHAADIEIGPLLSGRAECGIRERRYGNTTVAFITRGGS